MSIENRVYALEAMNIDGQINYIRNQQTDLQQRIEKLEAERKLWGKPNEVITANEVDEHMNLMRANCGNCGNKRCPLCYVLPTVIMPGSFASQEISLDRLVQLHERIEVIYNVDHYEASLLTSERQAMVGLGVTIHEAMSNLAMNTLHMTIEDVRTCGGKN